MTVVRGVEIGCTLEEINRQLRQGISSIYARTEFLNLGKIDFDPRPMVEGDKELIVKRLKEIIGG